MIFLNLNFKLNLHMIIYIHIYIYKLYIYKFMLRIEPLDCVTNKACIISGKWGKMNKVL